MDYEDRRGKLHTPQPNSIMKRREGVFSCCVHQEKILLIWPDYALDVPELPGGGIDAGEDIHQANDREFLEETGFEFSSRDMDIYGEYSQNVHFYAEDVSEFWGYKQSFFLFRSGLSAVYFDGERRTPEDGIMRWIPLEEAISLPVNVMHRKALCHFGLVR